MNECTVMTLNEKLKTENAQIIDVRERAEFAGGRISEAKSFPLGELEKRAVEFDRTKPIFVICRTGRRSLKAQKKLNGLGFNNVINVKGGFEAWKKEGLPFERDENAPWALERQVRLTAGLLVFVGVLANFFIHPYFIWLAGFIGLGLIFAAVTDTCAMGMILAKMPWNKQSSAEANCGYETADKKASSKFEIRNSD
ncbi:MAG TPA: rhodanese-like domain-containing protein [Pyrinomonadaceae bacterium]|nr:rhodanese-like domain-containing protein [Pyrinomonadaceae bacterium]